MPEQEPVVFRASSFCSGGDCVEVAVLPDGTVAVRHSRNPGVELRFTAAEWDAFLAGAAEGEFGRANLT